MNTIHKLLNRAFTIMALTGLALTGWNLIVAPSWGVWPQTDSTSSIGSETQ